MTLNKVITMKRVIYPDDVRRMCISHDFYTRGTNEEYSAMLEKVRAHCVDMTNEMLYEIAEDILNHSDEDKTEDLDIEGMMYILDNDVAYHTFEIREELDYE